MSKTVLVTGATGSQGGAVARELLKKKFNVRAMTRNPDSEAANALKALGADIVKADFENTESLVNAVAGAWGVFSVQNTWESGAEKEIEHGIKLASVAKDAGVEHFVYTSVQSADRNTGVPHFDSKFEIEKAVRKTGFPTYTILRPVFFMDNYTGPFFKPGLDEGKLTVGIRPNTPLQVIAVDDIGRYAALVFEKNNEFDGKALSLAGDSLTMPETVDILSSLNGKTFTFEPTPIEQVRQFSSDFASMLEWFDSVGYNVDIDELAQQTGIKPVTFKEWSADKKW